MRNAVTGTPPVISEFYYYPTSGRSSQEKGGGDPFYFGTDGLQLHRFYYTLNRTENYAFVNTIDAVEIMDNLGQVIVFPEKIFESYFCDFADPVYSVASLGSIDKTIYFWKTL